MNEEQEEKFSDDPNEHFRIENEILKMKLKAQFGDSFQMFTGNEELPPEVENKFLKSIINIEENFDSIEFIKIQDKIGNPLVREADTLTGTEISGELKRMMELLNNANIHLDFIDGPYDDRLIYTFITRELLQKEVEKEMPEGMTCNFIYEEFYPNHGADIQRLVQEFVEAWINGETDKMPPLLASEMGNEQGVTVTKDAILQRINNIFDAFVEFRGQDYTITNTHFTLNDDDAETGTGTAEGTLQFDAVIENGELVHFNGPFKLSLIYEYNYWNIYYFSMPGFQWASDAD